MVDLFLRPIYCQIWLILIRPENFASEVRLTQEINLVSREAALFWSYYWNRYFKIRSNILEKNAKTDENRANLAIFADSWLYNYRGGNFYATSATGLRNVMFDDLHVTFSTVLSNFLLCSATAKSLIRFHKDIRAPYGIKITSPRYPSLNSIRFDNQCIQTDPE